MNRATIDRIIDEILAERPAGEIRPRHECCRDGFCDDTLCVVHNSAGVRNIVGNGATRVSAGVGVDEAGGVEPDLAALIDHTLLKPDATAGEIEQLCAEALRFSFASVCINPGYVPLCARLCKGSDVKVCTVIGFPLGATSTASKAFEAEQAIRDGAQEVDMVINVGMLKTGEYDYVESDIFAVTSTARRARVLSKVIIETGLLKDEEKIKACVLAKRAGVLLHHLNRGVRVWVERSATARAGEIPCARPEEEVPGYERRALVRNSSHIVVSSDTHLNEIVADLADLSPLSFYVKDAEKGPRDLILKLVRAIACKLSYPIIIK